MRYTIKDIERLHDRIAQLEEEIKDHQELEEWAWVLIANAFGGDWTLAIQEWREVAERWRDKYHPDSQDVEKSLVEVAGGE